MGGDAEVRRSVELECVHSGLGCTGRHRGLRLQDKDPLRGPGRAKGPGEHPGR